MLGRHCTPINTPPCMKTHAAEREDGSGRRHNKLIRLLEKLAFCKPLWTRNNEWPIVSEFIRALI